MGSCKKSKILTIFYLEFNSCSMRQILLISFLPFSIAKSIKHDKWASCKYESDFDCISLEFKFILDKPSFINALFADQERAAS